MIINRKTDLFRLTTVASIETVLIIAGILTIITLLVEVSFALYKFKLSISVIYWNNFLFFQNRRLKQTIREKKIELKINKDNFFSQLQFYSSLIKDEQFASLSERLDKLQTIIKTDHKTDTNDGNNKDEEITTDDNQILSSNDEFTDELNDKMSQELPVQSTRRNPVHLSLNSQFNSLRNTIHRMSFASLK